MEAGLKEGRVYWEVKGSKKPLGINPQRKREEKRKWPRGWMWGEWGNRKKRSAPGAVTERKTEREGAKERRVGRTLLERGGGAFLLLEFLGQLSSTTVDNSSRKKRRHISHSHFSIITAWLSQPMSLISDYIVMSHFPLPVCAKQ